MFNYSKIFQLFNCEEVNSNIIENNSQFYMKFSSNNTTIKVEDILFVFEKIPSRDELKINLSYDEEYLLTITKNSKEKEIADFFAKIEQLIAGDQEDTYNVEFCIRKVIEEDTLSIYCYERFSKWILNLPMFQFLSTCNDALSQCSDGIQLICYNDNHFLHSSGVSICPKACESKFYNKQKRDIVLKKKNDVSLFHGFDTILIPDDFNIVDTNCDSNIINRFYEARYILSLAYISDETIFNDIEFSFEIKGYRPGITKISYDNVLKLYQNDTFFSIYQWIYSDGNAYDKSQIVKNIISLHCKYSDITQISSDVFDTVKSNYNLYLKDNVKDYLQLKKDVVTSLQTYCENISKALNNYVGGLKSNFIAILGYLATILFSKGITKDAAYIFTEDISILTSFVLAGSLVVFALCLLHSLLQNHYYNSLIEQLKSCYQDIMEDGEIKKLIANNNLLKTAKLNFKVSMWVTSIIWVGLIIVLFIALDKLSGSTKLLFFINNF